MIVYDLVCEGSHTFEGWFASAEAFDTQCSSGLLSCPVCATHAVRRLPPAPYLNTGAAAPAPRAQAAEEVAALEQLRQRLVAYVLEHTEDVGRGFTEEARRIHRQEAAQRAIRGQATRAEVTELREEGVEVLALPLPPVPPDRTH